MRCDQIVRDKRTQAHRGQRSSAGNHAVKHNRQTACRRTEIKACQPGNIQSAHLADHINRIVRFRTIYCKRLFNNLHFFVEAFRRKSCSPSGNVRCRCTRERCCDCRAGRSIANSHFSTTDQTESLLRAVLCKLNPGFHRCNSFIPCHSGVFRNIFCPFSYFFIHNSLKREFSGYSDIHREHIHINRFRHHAHGGSSLSHVSGDCCRDILPALRHPLCYDSVIRTENNRSPRSNDRYWFALDSCKLNDRVLQQSQSAKRHRNIRKTFFCCPHCCCVQRSDARYSLLDRHFLLSLHSMHARTNFSGKSMFARKNKCGNPA